MVWSMPMPATETSPARKFSADGPSRIEGFRGYCCRDNGKMETPIV